MAAGVSLTSCVDDLKVGDNFLEKAPGVDVNSEVVFSKAEYVRNFLWGAYGQLYCEYTSSNCMNGAPIDVLSDSWHCYVSWGGPKQSYYTGGLTEDCQDTADSNKQGKFSYSTKNPSADADGRVSVYETIRKCWQLIENLPNVPDMTDTEKSQLAGEAYTIMASRYFDAFRNFGGLCLVDHSYAVGEDFTGGRATAMETVEFIDGLIQKAIDEPGFPWVIDDIDNWSGRLSKASARALRCQLWLYAASPLFNSAEPYMTYSADKVTEFTNIEHVWFGKKDDALWQKCLKACTEFFAENGSDDGKSGSYYLVWPSTEDEKGYRSAYRAAYHDRASQSNHEKFFDVQPQYKVTEWGWSGFAMDCLRQGGAVPTNELMEMFGMADGTNYLYADADIYGVGKNPTGIDIFENRDPRLYETIVVPREECNVIEDYKGNTKIQTWVGGDFDFDSNMNSNADNCASGYMMFKWVNDYWKIGNTPIGIPYTRLAEIFLIRAEAYAELGQLDKALADVNLIRSRVGLGKIEVMNPSLKLQSNKENLIKEILRERNCELGAESGTRIYDMIRRKLQDDFTKPLHEIRIWRLDSNGNRMGVDADGKKVDVRLADGEPWPKFEYDRPQITNGARRWWEPGYWTNKWYLDPVSRDEIQKGYGLTQNPGW